MNLHNQATNIRLGEANHNIYDTPELQKRRRKFLDFCTTLADDGKVRVCTMYETRGEVLSTGDRIYNFFNRYHNTIKMLPCWIVIELESKENKEALWKGVCETYYNLVRARKHFALFHTDGSKSYYFVFLDYLELYNYNPIQRAKIRELFTNKAVPIQYQQFIDRSFFNETKMPLPFAPHWRHGSIFDLITEYKP